MTSVSQKKTKLQSESYPSPLHDHLLRRTLVLLTATEDDLDFDLGVESLSPACLPLLYLVTVCDALLWYVWRRYMQKLQCLVRC